MDSWSVRKVGIATKHSRQKRIRANRHTQMNTIRPMNHESVRSCGDTSVAAGRMPGQLPWYQFVAENIAKGKQVLDIGCGLGAGLEILERTAREVVGQDIDPRLESERIVIKDLAEFEDNSYEVVTCVDVLEHVDDDLDFVGHLARVASEQVFLTTPNWTASRCEWPYHVREYTPRQLTQLLSPLGKVHTFKGTSSGDLVYPVKYPLIYDLLNDARAWWPTAFITKCIRIVSPDSMRIQSHVAALVDIGRHEL